jgi:hypothetical protein
MASDVGLRRTTDIAEVPVIIAGGGPVGLTLAMDIGWRGVPSLLFEEGISAEPLNPKCNTTNARSMEHFRRLGCADRLRAAGLPADHPTHVVYVTRVNGHLLGRLNLPASSMRRRTPALSIKAGQHQSRNIASARYSPSPFCTTTQGRFPQPKSAAAGESKVSLNATAKYLSKLLKPPAADAKPTVRATWLDSTADEARFVASLAFR